MIDADDIEQMVKPKLPNNIFELSDEIMKKNRSRCLKIVDNLLSQENLDEKSSVIKIVGLLSEQVRGLVSVSMLAGKGLSQAQIAETLNWTTGRVYIYLKKVSWLIRQSET